MGNPEMTFYLFHSPNWASHIKLIPLLRVVQVMSVKECFQNTLFICIYFNEGALMASLFNGPNSLVRSHKISYRCLARSMEQSTSWWGYWKSCCVVTFRWNPRMNWWNNCVSAATQALKITVVGLLSECRNVVQQSHFTRCCNGLCFEKGNMFGSPRSNSWLLYAVGSVLSTLTRVSPVNQVTALPDTMPWKIWCQMAPRLW